MPLIRNGFLADNDVDLETMVRYYLVHPLLHFFNTVHWILNLVKILSQSKFSNHEIPTPNLRSSKMVQRWKWVLTRCLFSALRQCFAIQTIQGMLLQPRHSKKYSIAEIYLYDLLHYSIAISWRGAFTLLYFLSYFELIYVGRVLFLLSFSLSQTAYESTTWQSTRSSPRTALTSDVDGWEMNPPSPDRYNSDPEANPQPEIELQTMTLDMTSGE